MKLQIYEAIAEVGSDHVRNSYRFYVRMVNGNGKEVMNNAEIRRRGYFFKEEAAGFAKRLARRFSPSLIVEDVTKGDAR